MIIKYVMQLSSNIKKMSMDSPYGSHQDTPLYT